MSMHEFEDVVEWSIRCLDKSPYAEGLDLRSIFWNLYEFQDKWDTSLTYFRLPEILIKHHFMYQIDVKKHPDYDTYKSLFDNLGEYHSIYVHPGKEWDSNDNPEAGHFLDGCIYFTTGSPLWQRFVDEKRLTGLDAIFPQEMDLIEIVELIVLEAEKQDDIELISYWYPLLAAQLLFTDEDELIKLQQNASLKKIRNVIYRTGAYLIEHDYGCLAHPDEEIKKKCPFLDWWFGRGSLK